MDTKFSGIGERIISRLALLNQKQSDLSRATGISTNAISQYVTGKRIPDTSSLFSISAALNTTMEWLLTGLEDTSTENIFAEDAVESALLLLFRKLDQRDKDDVLGIVGLKAHGPYLGNKLASSTSRSGDANTTDEKVG